MPSARRAVPALSTSMFSSDHPSGAGSPALVHQQRPLQVNSMHGEIGRAVEPALSLDASPTWREIEPGQRNVKFPSYGVAPVHV